MSLITFNALIVDPNVETRMRLKTATTAVASLKKILLINKASEGLARLVETETTWNLVFVSANMPRDDIAQFIKAAKETKMGGLCAYVLVMATKEQDSSSIAENILLGGDGFLFEPYSIDALIEITELATRVRHERLAAREKGALALMIPDLITQIDLIAYLRASGAEPGQSLKKFREMTGMLKNLSEPLKLTYFDLVIDKFIEAPLPKKMYRVYAGASSRIKKKLEDKAKSQEVG